MQAFPTPGDLTALGAVPGGPVALALGWLAVALAIGVGVALFAGQHLEGVVQTVEQDFSRSFWIGVAGQFAMLPVLGLIVGALALSVVGALAIPVVAVAFCLAAAGMGTLGFLATAQLTGGAFVPARTRATLSARQAALRALVGGVVFYSALWVAAALVHGIPVAGGVARGVAFAATWVAATAGFGATLWSRAGTRVPTRVDPPAAPVDDYVWATPTPITGVAAARRPVARSHTDPGETP